MSISEFEIKRCAKMVGKYIEPRRPPAHIRNEFDLSFRIDNQSVIIFEIRERAQQPNEKIEIPVAKATYVKKSNSWKIYWQRADMKWHSYEPTPATRTIEDFLEVIEKDEYGCFWG